MCNNQKHTIPFGYQTIKPKVCWTMFDISLGSWSLSWHIFSADSNFYSSRAPTFSACSFVARIFGHALEDSHSKSSLIHSLSVCISLLDPKRSIPSSMMYSFRNQQVYESPMHVNPDTIDAMLPKLSKFSYCGSLYNFEFEYLFNCGKGQFQVLCWRCQNATSVQSDTLLPPSKNKEKKNYRQNASCSYKFLYIWCSSWKVKTIFTSLGAQVGCLSC